MPTPEHAQRIVCTLLIVINCFASEVSSGNDNRPRLSEATKTTVGVYHWSGQATRSISQGVKVVADLGSSAVRIVLSPRSYRD